MARRQIKIRAMGSYLPVRVVRSEELDAKLGLTPGKLEQMTAVRERRYVSGEETASKMGALAAMEALEKAGLRYEDIDAIICGSGTYQQPIPCTAALIQKELGKEESGTPCFDVNSTCLSFVVGLDVVSSLIQTERFKRVLLISTEVASVGLPWHQLEACALFGDGAVAAVIEKTPENETSQILGAHQITYSSGSDTCQILGGGTGIHSRNHAVCEEDKRFLFSMDGRRVFKQASQHLPKFMEDMQKATGVALQDYRMVVPHQASGSAMALMRRKLEIEEDRWMDIIATRGNMIAASIPLALKTAIDEKRVRRGDRVLMMGTSAGFSIGAIAIEY